ncbi:MAG TPA: DUF4426 domain-containing protein [Arenimonas sp.]|nr:DUF4426 domain-containing protein [Arenimonas sp.]
MRLMTWLAATLLLALALPASAGSMRVGDLRVHYNAMPSTELEPEVARRHGLTRSANRALLSVSVMRGELGTAVGVPARVQAVATNLVGQRLDVRMREVRDGDAIYYLGNASISGKDVLTFDLTVIVEGEAPITATFKQEFFPQ